MKKSMLSLSVAFILCVGAFAQTSKTVKPDNEGGFILKGGVNLANISRDGGNVYEANRLTSFNIGFAVDMQLGTGISLQPGLIFTGKGSKTQVGQPTDASYFRATSNPMYIELPVNLVGKIPLGGQTKLLIGAGPYAAIGITGKNKVERKIFGLQSNFESDIKYSNDDPTTAAEEGAGYGKLKRFDYGANGLAGIDFGNLILSANYGIGFTKVNSGTNNRDDDNNKHRVLSINLGIKL